MARARNNSNSDSGKRRKGEAADRKIKKKVSILDQESVDYIDYKDVNLLRRFMSERAKIRARRVTGNDAKQQREVAKAIRVAREMALLPYSVRQVTSRNKGKRGDRDRGDREGPLRASDIEMPRPTEGPPEGSAPAPSSPPPQPVDADVEVDVDVESFDTPAGDDASVVAEDVVEETAS
jgi:small subunit ribosomal protein S18